MTIKGIVKTGAEIQFGIGTIVTEGGDSVAVVVDDKVASLSAIAARYRPPRAVPNSMREFIPEWNRWHGWLRDLGLKPSQEDGWQQLDAVRFMAPVPEPWDIFQTYHNFERPSIVTGRPDLPKAERVLPDIFFGSRSALAGYGDTVYREHGGGQFDFEVEITIVIGKTAYRVAAERAEEYIAGYAIANDFTMHHAWWRPIRNKSPINDNIRMKNFPGYTPMSRAIIPRDLAGDPHNLSVKTWVDGKLRQDIRTTEILWTVGELLEYLSWIMPLRPGVLILCGSPLELPLPPHEKKGVQPGQKVVCEVETLGRLENAVAEQSERQPKEPA
jgi:2-keto-4-pentenoate hydratase/2-oxohepta-3-ene-1,7-dioic acid hydratase in catechol pathway